MLLLLQAMKTGAAIDTTKKFNAATNRHAGTTLNAVKLDNETEQFHHDRVGLDVCKIISSQRQKLGLTQKVKLKVICSEYHILKHFLLILGPSYQNL